MESKISRRATTKSISLMAIIALVMVSAGLMPVKAAFATRSTTACIYVVPSTNGDPRTILANVTTFGNAGTHTISVVNAGGGTTPSSVVLESGKLNQQFR